MNLNFIKRHYTEKVSQLNFTKPFCSQKFTIIIMLKTVFSYIPEVSVMNTKIFLNN